MPTKDENSLFPDFNLGETRAIFRGDDAREFVLPGSIPSISDLSDGEAPEEHDCLPPLEHTGSWELSAKAVQKLAEVLNQIVHAVGQIYAAFVPIDRASRRYRKVVRWDERNRRRRLKGMPEKPCPYQRIWKTCIVTHEEAEKYHADK